MRTINGLNGDYLIRDAILFGGYNPRKYQMNGGIQEFSIEPYVLNDLVKQKFADENDCQNYSPSIKQFLESISGFEDMVTFYGYAVSPERDDYRVSVDEVRMDIPVTSHDILAKFVEEFHGADEFTLDTYGGLYHLRAWWD